MTAENPVPNLMARFLLALGHELGAAQAAYTGPLSTLIDFRRDLSDAEVDLFLHTIDTQTARLTARLDELTELARLQLSHLTLHCEPISITTLIESALGTLDDASRERVVIDHQPAAVVEIDEGHLRRVLIFLLEAALAHSPETSPVRLIITVNEPASVTVSISDLAERQPILDEAVGILDHADRLDQFATVGETRPNRGGRMAHILVIEDEPDFRQFVMAILKSQRHQVAQTASLREGLALARRDRPDLVLLDMTLPDGSGLDFLDQPEVQGLTVIAMTAVLNLELEEGLQARAVTFFVKPITGRGLIDLVNHCLTGGRHGHIAGNPDR